MFELILRRYCVLIKNIFCLNCNPSEEVNNDIKDINDRVTKEESNPSSNLIDIVPSAIDQLGFCQRIHCCCVQVEREASVKVRSFIVNWCSLKLQFTLEENL